MRVSCVFLRQGVPLFSSCEVLPCEEFVGRERDDKSCLCISLVLGLDGGGGENWFVLKAGLVAAAAAQGAPTTAKSYFVQPSTDCLVKGSPGEMTL